MSFSRRIVLITFAYSASAFAQQTVSPTEVSGWKALIHEERSPEAPGIPFLTWNENMVWVEENQELHYTILKGRVSQPINQLNLNGKTVYVSDSGDFEIRFGFRGYEKNFRITVLDAKNRVYRGKFRLTPPHQPLVPKKIAESDTLDFSPNRFLYSLGVGWTRIHYEQTNVVPFDEMALTLKGAITYRLVPNRWDLGISSFFNAVAFNSTSEFTIRYLGLNGYVGYHFLDPTSSLHLVLNAGIYYNSSYGTIGFADMYGPQLNPVLSYRFQNGNSAMVYGKYSAALSQSHFDLGKNREWATGVYYAFPLNPIHRMSVGIDYSQLELNTDTDRAKTSTFTLSASLSF